MIEKSYYVRKEHNTHSHSHHIDIKERSTPNTQTIPNQTSKWTIKPTNKPHSHHLTSHSHHTHITLTSHSHHTHITPHHPTSHSHHTHITLTSPHITSHHPTSPHITSHSVYIHIHSSSLSHPHSHFSSMHTHTTLTTKRDRRPIYRIHPSTSNLPKQ